MNDVLIHEKGICESHSVGEKTRIWAFTHILPGAQIGKNCNICDHVFIENKVCIGDNVTIKSGVQLWDGIEVGDNVFIGPNVTFTNDPFPRSKQYPATFSNTRILTGASLGANVTLLPGITVGRYAMVGAGAVVTSSVPDYAIVVGNPATIIGFSQSEKFYYDAKQIGKQATLISGVDVYAAPQITDSRGILSFFEFDPEITFLPQRSFMIYQVPPGKFRGNHAHSRCHQILICVGGTVDLMTSNGVQHQIMCLNSPHIAVHIYPKIWNVLFNFSPNATVIVYNSEHYDSTEYIYCMSELNYEY